MNKTQPSRRTTPPQQKEVMDDEEQQQRQQQEQVQVNVSDLDPQPSAQQWQWKCQSLTQQLAEKTDKLAEAESLIMAYRQREFERQQAMKQGQPNRAQRRAKDANITPIK